MSTTMTIRLYADRKKWPLTHVEVAVRHSRPNLQGRDVFAVEVKLEGAMDDAQRARLMEIADKCPVHLTLARGSEVSAKMVAPAAVPQPQTGTGHVACMVEACAD